MPRPPYALPFASLGGAPTVGVDVPISAIFLVIFVIGAASHMYRFRTNLAKGHKFIPSAATFGFCMARIMANILRIVWATRHTDIKVAIAAQVFVSAGVLLLFILNLIFVQRMLRSSVPRIGWSRLFSYFVKSLYVITILTLIIVITATVQSLYTLDTNIRRIDRDLQLYALSFLTFLAFLPLPILAFIFSTSRKPVDPFGSGSWASKGLIVGISGCLLTLGAGFRLGANAMPPRPILNPAWYQHRACFYIFNYVIEAAVVYLFLFGRIDLRFHVPNGSSKVKTYSKADMLEKNPDGANESQPTKQEPSVDSDETL
ncbi:hypothetical protein FQN57_001074 [Myotisia sp. PD_48]|nr:hypothetical protein FQN57_001074 [Myotisia sp. PD_48]